MKKFFVAFSMIVLCTSCAKARYLDQALELKSYADQSDETQAFVMGQDRKFDELLSLVKGERSGSNAENLRRYAEKGSFLDRFGDPILITSVQREGRTLQRWLYRYQTNYFGPKVYVFFDDNGQLVAWDYVP